MCAAGGVWGLPLGSARALGAATPSPLARRRALPKASFSRVYELVCVLSGSAIMMGRILMIRGFRVGMQAQVIPTCTSTADHRKASDAFHGKSGLSPKAEVGSED